jgi:tol-pal system protein YbgF
MGECPVSKHAKFMKRITTRVALSAAATSLLLSGCANQQVEQLTAQVSELQKQLVEVRKNQAGQQVLMESMETDVFVLKDEVETARTHRRGTGGMPRLPTVRIQPQHGPESVYDPRAERVAEVAPRPDPGPMVFDRLDDGGNLIRGGGLGTAERPAPQPRAAAPVAPERAPERARDRDAVQMYKDSHALVGLKNYTQAIDGFQQFIEKYPTHGYADNALYWMGECYYDRGLWRKSLETFQSVIQNYPLGNKAPDAMLKLGLCHYQLRNKPEAREVLTRVAEIFPKHPVAKIAMSKLEQLQ